MGRVTDIERVAGHPAIDYVNTLGGLPTAANDEYLFGYADLLTWVEGSALVDAATAAMLRRAGDHAPARADEVFDHALRLRAALDAVLRSQLEHRSAASGHRGVLREAYVAAVAHADLDPHGGRYTWRWPAAVAETLEYPLWPVAFQAVELLRFGPLERLARCGHCRWLFLDTSKNRSRRWCSMNACGARMKMRRYRASRHP